MGIVVWVVTQCFSPAHSYNFMFWSCSWTSRNYRCDKSKFWQTKNLILVSHIHYYDHGRAHGYLADHVSRFRFTFSVFLSLKTGSEFKISRDRLSLGALSFKSIVLVNGSNLDFTKRYFHKKTTHSTTKPSLWHKVSDENGSLHPGMFLFIFSHLWAEFADEETRAQVVVGNRSMRCWGFSLTTVFCFREWYEWTFRWSFKKLNYRSKLRSEILFG